MLSVIEQMQTGRGVAMVHPESKSGLAQMNEDICNAKTSKSKWMRVAPMAVIPT